MSSRPETVWPNPVCACQERAVCAQSPSARPWAPPSAAGRSTVGLYHLAWEVDTLAELERVAGRLAEVNALVGMSDHGTTKSLYGQDPDGLEFEVVWLIPADRFF